MVSSFRSHLELEKRDIHTSRFQFERLKFELQLYPTGSNHRTQYLIPSLAKEAVVLHRFTPFRIQGVPPLRSSDCLCIATHRLWRSSMHVESTSRCKFLVRDNGPTRNAVFLCHSTSGGKK